MQEIHTDMALEAHEYYGTRAKAAPRGVDISSRDFGGLKFTEITVNDEDGEKYIGKPMGTYITFESEDLRGSVSESFTQNRNFIAKELEKLLSKNNIKKLDPVLVVGLGNWDITPDALGPKAVSSLFVSRHLFDYMPELTAADMRPVSAISPGVLGTTGIETLEIIKGIVERTSPKCVIAIDSLVARSIERLGKSLQISDSGINPGSGVGNHRKALTSETLGIPVISVGVPTVVSAATVAENLIELSENSKAKESIDFSGLCKVLGADMIVTPKDIDELISDLSEVVASALNLSLHPGDVSRLLQ